MTRIVVTLIVVAVATYMCFGSAPGPDADSLAVQWVDEATGVIPSGTPSGEFFGLVPGGEGIEWEWVETSRARRHEVRFPDGSVIVSGWADAPGGGLVLEYFVAR